jgi:radical SAM protein with 4Fe4S-binding SPASM domain
LGLNDGKGVMFVSHTGLVHPSGFLPILCGMFPQTKLNHIYRNSPIFRRLRDASELTGKCGLCEYRHLCGGSRARAYALTGTPYAEEPDCSHIPKKMQSFEYSACKKGN